MNEEYKTDVLNVFVNGKVVSPDLYTVDGGTVEFVKPLIELFPDTPPDFETGKPVFWVIVEMECE